MPPPIILRCTRPKRPPFLLLGDFTLLLVFLIIVLVLFLFLFADTSGSEITFGLGTDLGDNGAFGLGLGRGLGLGPDLGGCGALGGGGVLTVRLVLVLGNGTALPPPKPGSENNELGSICGLLGEGAGLLCRLGLSGSNKRIAVPSALVPTLGLIPPFPAATTSS